MTTLTKAEEDIMRILWRLKKANVKAIRAEFKSPKPAYNTVSTIVRILESKGVVDYDKEGKSHIYYPLLKQEDYSNENLNAIVNNYFQGSFKNLVSFFVNKNDVSVSDLEEVLKQKKTK